jgi:hypothetical protein
MLSELKDSRLRGWELSSIVTGQSGNPFSMMSGDSGNSGSMQSLGRAD